MGRRASDEMVCHLEEIALIKELEVYLARVETLSVGSIQTKISERYSESTKQPKVFKAFGRNEKGVMYLYVIRLRDREVPQ